MFLRIKPEDLRNHHGTMVNFGGRRLAPEETPSGNGELLPGDVFEADLAWYNERQHWHFLERFTPAQLEDAPFLGPPKDGLGPISPADFLEVLLELPKMTKAQLVDLLREAKVDFSTNQTKGELLELATNALKQAQADFEAFEARLAKPEDGDEGTLEPEDDAAILAGVEGPEDFDELEDGDPLPDDGTGPEVKEE